MENDENPCCPFFHPGFVQYNMQYYFSILDYYSVYEFSQLAFICVISVHFNCSLSFSNFIRFCHFFFIVF